jgi:hypothetical protein
MRIFVAVLFSILGGPAIADSDGELTWTEVSFCNAAGYCVRIDTTSDGQLSSVGISHNGAEILVPDLKSYGGEPDLRSVRLVSVSEPAGFTNRLEIPFFGENRTTLVLRIVDDKVDPVIEVVTVGE